MKAMIFNSGLGNRMGDLTKEFHKSMTRLSGGETIFHRQLRLLRSAGVKDIVVTTGPFADQLTGEAKDFPDLNFTFVHNDLYAATNYIYSMYLARHEINDDMLFLHGDLVFDKALVPDLLACEAPSAATVNFHKALPEKDFKGRVQNGRVQEVSIHIFDADCYAFQPLYKLDKATAQAWANQVEKFVDAGQVKCYAENAFNAVWREIPIRPLDVQGLLCAEIDNQQDKEHVSNRFAKECQA